MVRGSSPIALKCLGRTGRAGHGKSVWRISRRRSHSFWNTGAKTPCVRCQPTQSRNSSWLDEARRAASSSSAHGCILRREGKEHSLWENPQTGHAEAVPRHAEKANLLAKRICRKLSIRSHQDKTE